MSSDERSFDDLKSLVVHTLETNGVLGQIRAQLRANVYKAIDCDDEQGTQVVAPSKLTKSPVGRLMAEIVAEFFEFYEFRHSLSVFIPESNLGKEMRSRTEVAFDAGLSRVRTDVSILEQLIDFATNSSLHRAGEGWHSSASSTTASSPPLQSVSLGNARAEGLVGKADKGNGRDGHGDEGVRVGGHGGAAAIASALSAVVGPGSRKAGDDPRPDDARGDGPEDVSRERRKPLGKLPSLTGSGGKEMLPPFKVGNVMAGHGIGGASGGSTEEVSLGEGTVSSTRDKHLDKHVARLRSPTAATGIVSGLQERETTSPSVQPEAFSDMGTPEPKESAVEQVSNLSASSPNAMGAVRSRSRSASASPVASAVGSPPLSSAQSPAASEPSGSVAQSPAQSPAASMSRSLGTTSEVNDTSHVQSESCGTPTGGAVRAIVTEDAESVSIDESEGSGSIEIGTGRGGGGALQRAQDSLSAGPLVTVGDRGGGADEDEVEEEIEESMGDSIEGYHSDNNQSSNDKF